MGTPGGDPATKLMATLDEVERIATEIRGLKGLRSVKWEQLRDELRQAASDIEQLAHAARAWKV